MAVDENQIEADGDAKWLHAAVETESKLLLDIEVFGRPRTDPAAAFLRRLTDRHDDVDAAFGLDADGYQTALARQDLSGHLNYTTRYQIEKWFQTVAVRIDRFHSFWRDSAASDRRGPADSGIITTTTPRIKPSTVAPPAQEVLN